MNPSRYRFLFICILIALHSGCSRKSTTSGSTVTADDCFRPLEQGIYNQLDVTDRAGFSAKFRDWLKTTREERKRLKESSGGSASIGFGPLSFDGSGGFDLDRLEDFDAQFERDSNLILSDDRFFQFCQRSVDSTLIEGYYRCLEKIPGGPGPVLQLQRDSSNTSIATLSYTVVVGPENGQKRTVKVKSIYVGGGTLEGNPISNGDTLSSENPVHIFINRDKLPGGGIAETRIALYTDHGSLGKLIPAILPPPPKPTPTPTPAESAEQKAARIEKEKKAEAIKRRIYNIQVKTQDVSDAGTDCEVYVTLHGEYGDSPEVHLDVSNHNDHERGDDEVYPFELSGVGNIKSISIRRGPDQGKGEGWAAGRARVEDSKTHSVWEAEFNRWFEGTSLLDEKDAKKIQ